MMFNDDLCSTATSLISSTFTDFDDGASDDGGEQEAREYKYVPDVPVKTEIDVFEEDANEDALVDHFLAGFGESEGDSDGEQIKRKKKGEGTSKQRSPRSSRKGREKKKIVKEEEDSWDDGDNSSDEDFKLREDGRKGKKKTPKKSPGSNKTPKKTPIKKEDAASGKRRPKASEMTPEEREMWKEKWREEARARRARKRAEAGQVNNAKAFDKSSGSEDSDSNYTPRTRGRATKRTASSRSSGSSRRSGSGGGGGKRRKVGEMTPEEREVMKAKWREEARMRRALKREAMTPEQRQEQLRQEAERKREQRAKEKGVAVTMGDSNVRRAIKRETMTPEQKQEHLRQQAERRRELRAKAKATKTEEEIEEEARKAREKKRQQRAMMTEEQKKEMSQKVILRRMERLAAMTEEEKQVWRQRRAMAQAALTPEQREEKRKRLRDRYHARVSAMTPEERAQAKASMTEDEKQRFKMARYLQRQARLSRMTSEQRERYLAKSREASRRRRAQMTADDMERRRQMAKAYRDNMTPEQRAKHHQKLTESYRRRKERLERDPEKFREMQEILRERRLRRKARCDQLGIRYRPKVPRDSAKKARLKKRLEMQKLLESGKSVEEIEIQIEPPEERERRLMRARMNRAKLNLRKQLQNVGASPEVIENRLSELEATFQPVRKIRSYKPRPDLWKPLDPHELKLLEEDPPGRQSPSKEPREQKGAPVPSTSVTSQYTSPAVPGPSHQPPQHLPNYSYQNYPYTYQNVPSYPHLQPQTPPQSFPLQHILDGITYQESGGSIPAGPTIDNHRHYTNYQHDSNSHPDYASSYDNDHDAGSHFPSSPPDSPGGFEDAGSHSNLSTPPPCDYSVASSSTKGTWKSVAWKEQPSDSGSTKKKNPIVHAVCDECGNLYNSRYLLEHKVQKHRNYFINHTCQLCGDQFLSSKLWYSHYLHVHSKQLESSSQPPPTPESSDPPIYRGRGRPRKNELSRIAPGTNFVPIRAGPQKSTRPGIIRDVKCDECGNSYNHLYIAEHKFQLHNPTCYHHQTCQLCGEKFTRARLWHRHYNRVHVRPFKDTQPRPFMCDICGDSFRQKLGLDNHKHFLHGDGLKKENYRKCPLCPEEKLYKNVTHLRRHLKAKHPDYTGGDRECYRCDQSFLNNIQLGEHVKAVHKDSCFPCEYCNAVRFTENALDVHLLRCKKVNKETRAEIIKRTGGPKLERIKFPCEFCPTEIRAPEMTRHYATVHKLTEERYSCNECGKSFKTRLFWMVHLDEKHEKTVEEIREVVRYLQKREREGMVVENPEGVLRRSRGKGVRLVRNEKVKGAGKRKRRNYIVIAEEEEGMGMRGGEEEEMGTRRRSTRNRSKAVVEETSSSSEEEFDEAPPEWDGNDSEDD